MIFDNLREARYIKNNVKVKLSNLFQKIEEIRTGYDEIAICPTPTENSWQGVLSATVGLFPKSTFQIPQYFSNSVYNKSELILIAEKLASQNFKKIIFSGYVTYFKILIEEIYRLSGVKSYLIYHGSFSTNREDNITAKILYEILELQKSGKIKRIGFVKKGMSETLSTIASVDSVKIDLFTNIPGKRNVVELDKRNHHVGVFTHDQYRKNIDNQIAAALMIDDTLVHTKRYYDYEYLFSDNKIVLHSNFDNHESFLCLLGSMDVNMYVSFSECFGQVITESMAAGVPCLAANNSGVFDFDKELFKLLVVQEYDNSNAIYRQLQHVLNIKETIKDQLISYVHLLNQKSIESKINFLQE